MTLPGNTLCTGVGHGGTREAHQRDHTPQVEIHFTEIGKFLQYPCTHQAIIRMVIYHFRSHGRQYFIKTLRRKTFKKAVRFPAGTHPVDDIIAVEIGIDHLIHGVDVILPVTINGNGDIATVFRLHQASEYRILMPPVAALRDADIMPILFGQAADDLPGLIPAAVVDKQYPTVFADLSGCGKILNFLQEQRRRNRQNSFLIIARNHNVKNRCHFNLPVPADTLQVRIPA